MSKDFGEIEVKSKYADRYKGKKGEVHRLGIIYPKAGGGPFEEAFIHFKDKYFICKNGICCEKLGPADQRFACLVVKYKTNKQGQVIATNDPKLPFDYEVMEWVIGSAKMKQLIQKNQEFPLKSHDLMVSCTGSEEYQQLDFSPCKESIWQMKPEFKEELWLQSEKLRSNLKNALGADLTIDEIKDLLGVDIGVTLNSVINTQEDVTKLLADV